MQKGLLAVAVLLAGCGSSGHVSMQEAVARSVCGACPGVTFRLSGIRTADGYATADVEPRPPGRYQGGTFLLHRRDGDWRTVTSWTDLAGTTCAELAREFKTPEDVLARLRVGPC